MSLPTRSLPALLALTVAALPCAAQAAPPDSGTFVIRHASDTVAVEHFSRSATKLEGSLAMRGQKGTAQLYQAIVAPDASVALIEVTVQQQPDSGQKRGRVVQRARVIFKGDSAAVDDVTNHGLQTRVFGTERGAVPYLNLSFALLEQAVRRSRAADAAGTRVPLFNLGGGQGGGQTLEARLSPIGTDSVALAIGTVEFHLRVDQAGRVLGGRIPAQEVVVDRLGS